jgi:squalene-associated FAD-dependent desaturase
MADGLKRVAVIGGGWAGMAAAVALAEKGLPVTVFEAARQLGGRARRADIHGLPLDNGPHLLLGAYRKSLGLMARVHAGPLPLKRTPLRLDVPGHFRLSLPRLPAPLHLAWGLLTARGLSWRERLAAARFVGWLRRRRFRLGQDTSVESLLRDHGQDSGLRRHLWEPLCLAALNTPIALASAQVFLHVLRDSLAAERAASDMLLPLTDFSALFPEPAAACVRRQGGEVRLSCPVRHIRRRDSGLVLATDDGEECFDQVVCAVPPQRLPALTADLPELAAIREMVADFRYQPIYSLYLQYPEDRCLPAPLIGLDGGPGQWVFDRGRTHGQKGLMAVVISGPGRHETLGPELLLAAVAEELAPLLGRRPPLWGKVVAEKRATFSCEAGVKRPPNATPLANFYLAGDYTEGDYPATLEGAVRSGLACAARISA